MLQPDYAKIVKQLIQMIILFLWARNPSTRGLPFRFFNHLAARLL